MGRVMLELARLAGETGLRLPPELTMLGKTLLHLDEVPSVVPLEQHLGEEEFGDLGRSIAVLVSGRHALAVVVLGRIEITHHPVGPAEELVRPRHLQEVTGLGGPVQQADGNQGGGRIAVVQKRRTLHPKVARSACTIRSTEPLLELFERGVVIARVVRPIPVAWHRAAMLPRRLLRSDVRDRQHPACETATTGRDAGMLRVPPRRIAWSTWLWLCVALVVAHRSPDESRMQPFAMPRGS